jgi:hypothetical protein
MSAVACIGLVSAGAQAAQVTLVGDTINYVYDDTQAAIAYFGAPTIVGDTVVFTPGASFSALSENGAGTVTTTSTFIFDSVYHQGGLALQTLNVSESGDYFINGDGEVSVDLFLQGVTNAGGGTLGSGSSITSWSSDVDTGGALTTWGSVDGALDATTFTSPSFLGGGPAGDQTDIRVSIQNTLRAETAGDGSSDAFIQKKLNFVAVAAVPVPAAVWLFGSALLGLLAVGRRRSAPTA